jgi:hypothetical protein
MICIMTSQNVIYLFGAGSTHGEAKFQNDSLNLLTKEIVLGIINRINKEKIKSLYQVINELARDANIIEHLITLYESIGTSEHYKVSQELKKLFRKEILFRLQKFDTTTPKLLCSLFDIYNVKKIDEKLLGIFTLNYDSLIETAIKKTIGDIDYSFRIDSDINKKLNRNSIKLLKLHGSFDWKKDFPVKVIDDGKTLDESEIAWIPPGVDKKRDIYPFFNLWSAAKEFTNCNILRVIGCSLNRNDWALITLIYTIQKLNEKNDFSIELIDFDDSSSSKKREYPYLRIKSLLEITECERYLRDLYPMTDKAIPTWAREPVSSSNNKLNIFEWWLRAKGFYMKNIMKLDLKTSNSYLKKLIDLKAV